MNISVVSITNIPRVKQSSKENTYGFVSLKLRKPNSILSRKRWAMHLLSYKPKKRNLYIIDRTWAVPPSQGSGPRGHVYWGAKGDDQRWPCHTEAVSHRCCWNQIPPRLDLGVLGKLCDRDNSEGSHIASTRLPRRLQSTLPVCLWGWSQIAARPLRLRSWECLWGR